ncbi:hypothetical protein E2C01_037785 [Portunus trituberculatus]|uniref:Uncharacterized protein n=1 Tax=Portunus trituberculatus TaxID=210409 RepID=A0A5B7F911_PORTR|nr:hypothetical protein [Portunus trituberculatus]
MLWNLPLNGVESDIIFYNVSYCTVLLIVAIKGWALRCSICSHTPSFLKKVRVVEEAGCALFSPTTLAGAPLCVNRGTYIPRDARVRPRLLSRRLSASMSPPLLLRCFYNGFDFFVNGRTGFRWRVEDDQHCGGVHEGTLTLARPISPPKRIFGVTT